MSSDALREAKVWLEQLASADRELVRTSGLAAALLAEVARLEQAATEARHGYQDNLAASFRERDSLAAALAVARERDQRRTKAFERIARMFERVDGMTVSCGSLESAADIARAALVDEPAADEWTPYHEFRKRTDPPPWGDGRDAEEPPASAAADEPAPQCPHCGNFDGRAAPYLHELTDVPGPGEPHLCGSCGKPFLVAAADEPGETPA